MARPAAGRALAAAAACAVAAAAEPRSLGRPAARPARPAAAGALRQTETGLDVSNPLGAPGRAPWACRCPACCAGSGRPSGAGRPGRGWRDPAARAAGVRRLLGGPGGHGRGVHRGRLVPHRRHRPVEAATGHLVIRGRVKELIITGGLNVYPREVELVLESHPAVAEAAVAGVPHRRWGEQVTAWVVLRPGREFDEPRSDRPRADPAGRVQVPEAGVPGGRAAAEPARQAGPPRPHRQSSAGPLTQPTEEWRASPPAGEVSRAECVMWW